VLVLVLGTIWGTRQGGGVQADPDYFPEEVGVVGVEWRPGRLGGSSAPSSSATCWNGPGSGPVAGWFMLALSVACLIALHYIVEKMMHHKHPEDMRQLEEH